MGKISKKIPFIIAITMLLISIALLLFPTVSNIVNQMSNNSSIKNYTKTVSTLSNAEKEKYLSDAKAYNESLTETVSDAFTANTYENIKPDYESVLNFEDGQMCSIEIPKINVNLPVYHGSSEEVLTKGAAHSANTSFPIGGENTHSVISAHTAYPGKVFFDNLTELETGDEFYIHVLDEKLCYKVCEINIVEPEDTSNLQIVYQKDLVTLVTCYPYAVNSHRLLVTGERCFTNQNNSTADTLSKDTNNNSIILFVLVIAVIIIIIVIIIIRRKVLTKSKGSNKI